MSADVNSVLARCLLDADFLREVSSNPERTLSGYGLDLRSRYDFTVLDFQRVQNFAGFITKVQHNDLWETVPYTRALMKYYGIEIEIFAAYHATHLRLRSAGVTKAEKVTTFLDFIGGRIDSLLQPVPGLRCILVHERIKLDLKAAQAEQSRQPAEQAAKQRQPTANAPQRDTRSLSALVPAPRGWLRVARFEFNPITIESDLRTGQFAPDRLPPYDGCIVYWGDEIRDELRLLEVDDLTAALLASVDARRTVEAVVQCVAVSVGEKVDVERVRGIFDGATELGLLELRELSS